MKKQIQTDKAPAAIGPYSQAIATENFIFCSGQVGIDPQTGSLLEGIEKQTSQAIKNLEAVLAEAGSGLTHVVKTTVYLKNIDDFAKMNTVYETFFKESKPARATVGVANLPKGALVEVEAIALK